MQVVTIGLLIVFPGAIFHIKKTIPKRRFSFFCRPPMVIIAVWVFSRTSGLPKPVMLIARMVYHQVHYQSDVSLMQALQQFVEIFHRTERWHNAFVIAYIIAIIAIW